MSFAASLLEVILVAAFMLWGCGFFVARLLLPRHYRPLGPFLAPLLGFSSISMVAHFAGGVAGASLSSVRWPLVILATAGWALILLDRRWRRWPRSATPALLICLLAFLLALAPLLATGYMTTLGGTIDAVTYAVRSEYVQEAPLTVPKLEPGKPYLGWVGITIGWMRCGDSYLVGLLGLLTGRRSYELLTVVSALFFALTAGAAYCLARLGLGIGRRGGLLGAALVGSHNLLLWPVYDNFLPQSIALALLPGVLAIGLSAQRRPRWRTAMLFGLLWPGLLSVYPLFALLALAAVLGCWGLAWILRPEAPRWRSLGRAGLWWLLAAAVTVLSSWVMLSRARAELEFMSDPAARGLGNLLVFLPSMEIFGLISHAAASLGGDWRFLPERLLQAAALVCCGLAAYGWWRLRPQGRIAAVAPLLVSAAGLAHQRWLTPYPYGYFKILTTVVAELMVLVAVGLVALWQTRRRAALPPSTASSPRARRKRSQRRKAAADAARSAAASSRWRWLALRWTAAGAAFLLLAINVKHSWWSGAYVRHNAVAVDRDLLGLAQSASLVDPDAWILLDLKPSVRDQWLGYLLNNSKIRYREPLAVGDVPDPGAAKAFFRYAMVERDLDASRRETDPEEPWYDPAAYRRLAGGSRYELRQRNDAILGRVEWERRWPAGTAIELTLPPTGEGLAARLDGELRQSALAAATPRTLRLRLYSLEPASRLVVGGLGPPLSLETGGWTVDLDVSCLVDGRVAVDHPAGEVILRDVLVLRTPTGRRRTCLTTQPLRDGIAYLEPDHSAAGRMTLRASLLRPPGQGEQAYRLGLHVIETKTGKWLGVWGLDFPKAPRLQRGSLELDLRARAARGEIDGRAVAVEAVALEQATGSFEGSAVWWQFNPLVQLEIVPMLWFQRGDRSAVTVTRAAPAASLVVLAAP